MHYIETILYRAVGKGHYYSKKLTKRSREYHFRMVDVPSDIDYKNILKECSEHNISINGIQGNRVEKDKPENVLFPIENIVPLGSFPSLKDSFQETRRRHTFGVKERDAEELWLCFVQQSMIPNGYKYAGLSYAGYILDFESWCLPSWIWTNAANVRMYAEIGKNLDALRIANILLEQQQPCGGWIVRFDYGVKDCIPILAPNDSAYIANNAILTAYRITGDVTYLEAAKRCAEWILANVRDDGMIWSGFDIVKKEWITNTNIVDIGFVAGLFASLYQLTEENKYKVFLSRFSKRYIELFQRSDGLFSSALDGNDKQRGGAFGRGQAWALEGLIPTFEALHGEMLKATIDTLVNNIISKQNKDGSWPYNFTRKIYGKDCKGTPILAHNLLKWIPYYSGKRDAILNATCNAMAWCRKNTVVDGSNATGGIFSYTNEGAVVHHSYTETAFVYSSCYAVEVQRKISGLRENNDLHK